MTNTKHAEKNLRIHGWVNAIAGITFLIPIITLFYQHTGLSLFEIALVANAGTFLIWLLELPTSVIADTAGRKLSLTLSVVCNFLSALTILLFPSFIGFIIASAFAALYWSFWSGTGQAFLAEHLRVLGRSKDFGKVIGSFMSYEQIPVLVTPFIASYILYQFGDFGYVLLAALDVLSAGALVILVLHFKDYSIAQPIRDIRSFIKLNVLTAKEALSNTFWDTRLRTVVLYRTMASHAGFFFLVALPTLSFAGMPDWYSGFIVALAAVAVIIGSKYAYILGERFSYNSAWIISSIGQAIFLLIAAFLLRSWILIALLFVIQNLLQGVSAPSWNHILVEETEKSAIATTRSLVMAVYVLHMTIGRQLLASVPLPFALVALGILMLLANALFAPKLMRLKR